MTPQYKLPRENSCRIVGKPDLSKSGRSVTISRLVFTNDFREVGLPGTQVLVNALTGQVKSRALYHPNRPNALPIFASEFCIAACCARLAPLVVGGTYSIGNVLPQFWHLNIPDATCNRAPQCSPSAGALVAGKIPSSAPQLLQCRI
jgi:hypothetical protein